MRLLPCLLTCVMLVTLAACEDSNEIKWSELRYDQDETDGSTCVETEENDCSTTHRSFLGHGVGAMTR